MNVSYKAVKQVWNIVVVNAEQGTFSFKHVDEMYNITLEVIERALNLPLIDGKTPDNYFMKSSFSLSGDWLYWELQED